MIPLQVVAMALSAFGALAVVLVRDLVRQALVLNIYGVSLVVLFLIFQAPDVALSGLVVGSMALPLMVLLALAKVRSGERRDE